MGKDRLWNPLYVVVLGLVTWLIIAHAVYAVRHPDMTEMRRFLNTWDALMFRK